MKVVFLIFVCLECLSAQLTVTNTGPCACDITSNKCNVDCCCDPSCSTLEISTFTCTSDQISPLFYGCFPSELLFQNNTPYSNVSVGNQYCVYQDNYTLRNFYVAPVALGTTGVAAIADTGSMPTLSSIFNPSNEFSSSSYVMGSPIYSLVQNNTVGTLGVSRPGIGGACVDGLAVGYLVNEFSSCSRVISNISSECANLPDTSFYYIDGMVVPAYPSVMIANFANNSSFITGVSFAKVVCAGCNVFVTYNSSTSVCENVVTKVKYEISGEANISLVNITLTYGIFSNTTTFNQEFNVTFIKTGYSTNVTPYSGNPGYIVGYSVMGLNASGSPQNFSMITGGSCINGSSSSVLFGFNSFSDCSINISSYTNSSCVGINQDINGSLSRYLVPYLLPYGNLSQVNLVPRSINDGPSMTTSSPPCSVISQLTVYIIFARTGTLTLPQNTIIGYQTSYSYSNFSVSSSQLWVSVSVKFVDNSQTQFDLTSAVTRTYADNTVKDFLYLLYAENRSGPGIQGLGICGLMWCLLCVLYVLSW